MAAVILSVLTASCGLASSGTARDASAVVDAATQDAGRDGGATPVHDAGLVPEDGGVVEEPACQVETDGTCRPLNTSSKCCPAGGEIIDLERRCFRPAGLTSYTFDCGAYPRDPVDETCPAATLIVQCYSVQVSDGGPPLLILVAQSWPEQVAQRWHITICEHPFPADVDSYPRCPD